MYGYLQYGYTQYGAIGYTSIAHTETFSDTITIDDPTPVELLFITYLKLFSEVLTITDKISKSRGRILNEIFTITDTVIKNTGAFLSDEIAVIDWLSRTTTRIFSELVTLIEDFFKSKALIKNEQIDLTDTFSKKVEFHSALNDIITPTDTIAGSRGKNFIDTIKLTENFKRFYNGLSTSWNKIATAVSGVWQKQFKP